MHELRRDGNERIPASQPVCFYAASIETENRLHPKKCLGYLACRKCQPPLKRDGSIEPGSVLRRVRLSQANQSSAQIPTVDKQQLDREGDQPQGAKLQQLAKRVTSSATFWAGF